MQLLPTAALLCCTIGLFVLKIAERRTIESAMIKLPNALVAIWGYVCARSPRYLLPLTLTQYGALMVG